MKTNHYVSPQIEVIEIEIENDILVTSKDENSINIEQMTEQNGSWN